MKLDWTYDPNTREAKTVITDTLYYTTNDGGQTINKFVNDKLAKTFHKYGKDDKFSNVAPTGIHIEVSTHADKWPTEVEWLAETYPEIVGNLYIDWNNGFKNKDGRIEDVGRTRGFGITDTDELISINRLCAPANFTEWWDWEVIATSKKQIDEDCTDGMIWRKNKNTGEIVRVSTNHPPMPCCVYPRIHGPWPVTIEDIAEHDGVMIPKGLNKFL